MSRQLLYRQVLQHCLLLAVGGLLPCGFVRADDWPVARGPSHEPAPYVFRTDDLKQLPKEFLDDAAACIVYSSNTNLIEEDGTIEAITHEVIHFNGRKGIERHGEYRKIYFDPNYDKPTLNEARVIKADGRVVAIEPRHLQLRDVNTDYAVYNHDKQLVISFPGLEVGDTIDVKWTLRGKNPEFQGRFFTRYDFGDDEFPVGRDVMCVRVPKDKPFKYGAAGGKIEPVITEDATTRTFVWQALNRHELPSEDDLPPKEELRLQVVCSTFASWDEVARWNQNLWHECWQCTPEIKTIVQEATKDATTPVEKARALTYWLRRNIRYVSVGVGHDYTPHPPAGVLLNRYGDCKDGSQFLAVMLREAGLKVALVSICPEGDGQIMPDVPSPMATHAILQVTIDGREHWIDTTVSRAAWDYLPPADCNRHCYVIDADSVITGKPVVRVQQTPAARADDNRIDQVSRITVKADHSIVCERTAEFRGTSALAQREVWLDVPSGERRRVITTELQKQMQMRTHLTQLTIDDKKLKDLEQSVSAAYTFEVPNYFTGDGDLEAEFSDSKVWAKLVALEWDNDRKFALDLGVPFDLHHRFIIQLPPAYHLEGLPKDKSVRSKWGTFSVKVTAKPKEPHKLTLEFHTRLEKARVEPADFDSFRQFHDEVALYYRSVLFLKPVDALADAAALEKVVAQSPKDHASALVLAKLYIHNEKLEDARRVLSAALKENPGEDKLAEMLIIVTERATRRAATEQAGAYYQLAQNALKKEQYPEALEHLQAAGKADPAVLKTLDALRIQGQVREKLKQPANAILAYQDALKLAPDDAESLAACVRLRLATDNRDAALLALFRYTLAAGTNADRLATAAEMHLQMDRLDDAATLAEQSMKEAASGKAARVLALISFRRGDWAQAAKHLETAVLDDELCEKLVRVYLALGRLADAERVAKAADSGVKMEFLESLLARRKSLLAKAGLTEKQHDAIDHLLCAEFAHDEGRPAEQIEALLAPCFTAGAEISSAYGLRGLLALERGRFAQALADAERAVAQNPDEARGYFVRGRVRLERGAEGALADLTKAAELSKRKDARILHWLASALYQSNQRDAAVEAQREAVALLPADKELAEQLRVFQGTK